MDRKYWVLLPFIPIFLVKDGISKARRFFKGECRHGNKKKFCDSCQRCNVCSEFKKAPGSDYCRRCTSYYESTKN